MRAIIPVLAPADGVPMPLAGDHQHVVLWRLWKREEEKPHSSTATRTGGPDGAGQNSVDSTFAALAYFAVVGVVDLIHVLTTGARRAVTPLARGAALLCKPKAWKRTTTTTLEENVAFGNLPVNYLENICCSKFRFC